MPVSPADHDQYAIQLRRHYLDAEYNILRHIARQIAKGKDSPDWAVQKMAQLQLLRRLVQAEINQLRGAEKEIHNAIEAAYLAGGRIARTDLERIGAKIPRYVLAERQRPLETLVAKATDNLRASHLRILRSAEDIYRSVVVDAAAQTLTGSLTRRQAAQQALDRFGGAGITGYVDKAGRNWDLASYAEMAVRSTTGQAAVAGHTDQLIESGYDLVIVSTAGDNCKVCQPWAGKILSLTGQTPGRPTLQQAIDDGLYHPNCRCSHHAYIPGLTRRMDVPSAREAADGYAERQQQRYNERMIRKHKMAEALAITPEAEARASTKVQEWQSRQREFIDETGRRRDYGRESITRAR